MTDQEYKDKMLRDLPLYKLVYIITSLQTPQSTFGIAHRDPDRDANLLIYNRQDAEKEFVRKIKEGEYRALPKRYAIGRPYLQCIFQPSKAFHEKELP